MLMKLQYQIPVTEWELLRTASLLCDSSLDGGLDDIVDEPLY